MEAICAHLCFRVLAFGLLRFVLNPIAVPSACAPGYISSLYFR
jgi:hypothetical protein